MIAIILAGGFAVRLGYLTENSAKPLLKVGSKPIINHIMDKLKDQGEIEKVVVATSVTFEQQFKDWLSRTRYPRVFIRPEVSMSDRDKPGAIKSLSSIVEEFDSDSYLIVAGDNLFTSDLKGFFQCFRDRNHAVVVIHDVRQGELAKEFSVLEMDADGRIINFQEKPEQPRTTLIGTCIYLLPKGSLRRADEYLRKGGNPDSPGYFVQWLSRKEPVYGYLLLGEWWDLGTPQSYKEAINAFKNHKAKRDDELNEIR